MVAVAQMAIINNKRHNNNTNYPDKLTCYIHDFSSEDKAKIIEHINKYHSTYNNMVERPIFIF